jgi:hypothetical protein
MSVFLKYVNKHCLLANMRGHRGLLYMLVQVCGQGKSVCFFSVARAEGTNPRRQDPPRGKESVACCKRSHGGPAAAGGREPDTVVWAFGGGQCVGQAPHGRKCGARNPKPYTLNPECRAPKT